MQFMADLLKSLRSTQLKHTVVGPFQRYFMGYGQEPIWVEVLCEDVNTVAKVLGVDALDTSGARKKKNPRYIVVDKQNNVKYFIKLYEKGRGLFPERFESELLESAVVVNNRFNGLDSDREFWAALYMQVVHFGQYSDQIRSIYLDKIKERIGLPMKCQYTGFKCFDKVNANPNEIIDENFAPVLS